MFVTESEATGKECRAFAHMTIYVSQQGVAGTELRSPSFCIGNRCMNWRFETQPNANYFDSNRKGYCGLAGRP